MAIILRGTKGSALTHDEMDGNFQTITNNGDGSLSITPDINGGTIDGAVIGGASASNATFTTVKSTDGISIGRDLAAGDNLRIEKNITGKSLCWSVYNSSQVQSDVTTEARYFSSYGRTAAASFTLDNLINFGASQGVFGAGSTVTNQFGFYAASTLTGATNNYGFLSAINTGANRFNFYASGSADNSFAGNVMIHGAGKLGYTTGSGGAVEQINTRGTGVTLNKTNGAITLVSAAGSATWQSFTVNNTTVAATDTIHICQKSGTDLYMIHITAVAAGSFKVTFATTGGTTTEQPVFNFAVIKGVTS